MDNYFFDNKEELIIETSKYLVFLIDNDKFGIGINNVTEIINIQPFTEVPDMPEHITGIINLRDRIYPIMDLRSRFRKPLKEYDDRTCIVLVEFNSLYAGIIVDDILEVADVNNEQIRPAPQERTGFFNRFISEIVDKGDGSMLFIIDCDALFINETAYIEETNSIN
jgi:purine-binding chemotaxis protein CheW